MSAVARIRISVFVFFFASALPCLGAEVNSSGRIESVLFVNTPYPPYNIGEYGPNARGMAVDIARAIFDRMDIGLEYHLHPFNRALEMLKRGLADGTCILRKNEEREQYMAYSVPLFKVQEAIYYNPRSHPEFTWSDFSDLKGMRIGIVENYAYSKKFMTAAEKHGLLLEEADTNHTNFLKLVGGRIDLVLCNSELATAFIRKNPRWGPGIRKAGEAITDYDDYLTVSRSSLLIELLPQINLVIQEMQKDGTMDGIMMRY